MCLLLLKVLILTGVFLGNKNDCYLINYLDATRPILTLNGVLKRLYAQNDASSPNVATNVSIIFKICSLLITTLTYHVSKNLYIYEYT